MKKSSDTIRYFILELSPTCKKYLCKYTNNKLYWRNDLGFWLILREGSIQEVMNGNDRYYAEITKEDCYKITMLEELSS